MLPYGLGEEEQAIKSRSDSSCVSACQSLEWYLRRLGCMTPAEVVRRALRFSRLPLEWAVFRHPSSPAAVRNANLLLSATAVEYERDVQQFRIFDIVFPTCSSLEWHKDYRYGTVVPRHFARRLDIRDRAIVGDIKYIWELNRHQHLSALAYSSNKEIRKHVKTELLTWIEANPVLTGVNWTSSLELGLRVISWALLFPRITCFLEHDSANVRDFANSLYWHLRQIRNNLSFYSSANNHLIGELAGLYIGAVCFPWWPICTQWRAFAREALQREIQMQVTQDGINREQAMSYHLFTLELFLISYLVGRLSGELFNTEFTERLRSMLLYVNAVAVDCGDLPWFGDSDDARGFVLSFDETNVRVVMDLGALLFDEPRFLRHSPAPTLAGQVLLPDKVTSSSRLTMVKEREQGSMLLREGGKAILRNRDASVQAVMDFGEHGYTSIAAHAHADALSFVLAVNGRYLLIDPGTFAYHSHQQWRTYFRSTAGHNTVCIDGLDQSVQAGRFVWTRQARTTLLSWTDDHGYVSVEAEHDGYRRLPDPVGHRRKVLLKKQTDELLVTDQIDCQTHHRVEVFFHLHEDAVLVNRTEQEVGFNLGNVTLVFVTEKAGFRFDILRGTTDPMGGWRSRRFDQKEPIYTLRLVGVIAGADALTTSISIHH